MSERSEVMCRVYACGLRVAPDDPEPVSGEPEATEAAKEPRGRRFITPRRREPDENTPAAGYEFTDANFLGRRPVNSRR